MGFKSLKIIFLAMILNLLFSACSGSGFGGGSSEGPFNGNSPERLKISGKELIAPDGKPIMLRGFNWGNWGLAQPEDAGNNVKQGANVVRILLRWWGSYAVPTIDARNENDPVAHVDADHIARLDQEVDWAISQGLWVDLVIDSNCGQNGMQDAEAQKYCDPENKYGSAGHNFWTDPKMRAEFIDLWKYVANRYKGKTRIAMYEPLPEPSAPEATQAEVTEFYKEVIRAIRSVDDSAPFLIGATNAYNIRNSEDAYIPDSEFAGKLIYTGDLFVFTNQDQATNIANLKTRLQGLLDTRDHHNVPIFVQQTGVKTGEDPTYVYLNAVLSLLNQNQVPWAEWEYRDGSGTPNSFGVYYHDRSTGELGYKPDTLNVVKSYF